MVTCPLGSKARVGSLIHTWCRCTFPQNPFCVTPADLRMPDSNRRPSHCSYNISVLRNHENIVRTTLSWRFLHPQNDCFGSGVEVMKTRVMVQNPHVTLCSVIHKNKLKDELQNSESAVRTDTKHSFCYFIWPWPSCSHRLKPFIKHALEQWNLLQHYTLL